MRRYPIRNAVGRLVAYAVLLSNRRGIEQWAIQRGNAEPQRARFPNRRAVLRARLRTKE